MVDVEHEIAKSNERLPIALPDVPMPLEMTIRSIALAVAQRHCGDTTVREGNLYQQLKMDNKLAGPLTLQHVIHTALIFELYLHGKWSEGIMETAVDHVLDRAMQGVNAKLDELRREAAAEVNDDPIRPHSGE